MAKESAAPTYRRLLDEASQLLADVSPTPRIDAEILLQHIISKPLAWLIAHGNTSAMAPHIERYFELVGLRHQGQPIAYLLGYKEFWSLNLEVNPAVLIPRPDTETLVEHALERVERDDKTRILDLGTGSGAIGLAIAKERPYSQVLATDYHADALDVAMRNATRNAIHNIKFLRSNWFETVPESMRFDLIAANPPYVEHGDSHLKRGDLRFEPNSALVSSGGGTSDLAIIIRGAYKYLNPAAWLIVEHGYNQAEQVQQLFRTAGYCKVELFNDINGLPRCTTGQI